jgi:two-component system, OmpR family, phosphate regulon sensor histidine kinase PhoR
LTGRIFLKLISGVIFLMLLALVTVDYFAPEAARAGHMRNLVNQTAAKARMLTVALSDPGALTPERVRLMAQAAGGRITVVRRDGVVLVDSSADAAQMENHGTRKEFREAFRGQAGTDERTSATLGIRFLYVAVPAAWSGFDGAVRIAEPLSEVEGEVARVRAGILVSTALAFLPAMLVAALLARWISRRFATVMAQAGELARGNFRARAPAPDNGEFGRLTETLNETARNLQQTVEQLEREHTELEKLERIRKDFVINVSHELRTPLASIQGYTETLMDGALNDPDYNMRFLGIIRHNAERLARLTEDLLTLSRIEQKHQELEFECHPLNRLLEDAIELIRPIAVKGGISLHTELPPRNTCVWCDSEAVSQVLSNLLDNAIKYTPEGGAITVGAYPAGRFVEVYVRDTGIGIPPEDLPRLFERFYRVDKARSRQLGGTGLGLSIVKHMVASHNGVVRVESVQNSGSTFFFTLPADASALSNGDLNPEFTAS